MVPVKIAKNQVRACSLILTFLEEKKDNNKKRNKKKNGNNKEKQINDMDELLLMNELKQAGVSDNDDILSGINFGQDEQGNDEILFNDKDLMNALLRDMAKRANPTPSSVIIEEEPFHDDNDKNDKKKKQKTDQAAVSSHKHEEEGKKHESKHKKTSRSSSSSNKNISHHQEQQKPQTSESMYQADNTHDSRDENNNENNEDKKKDSKKKRKKKKKRELHERDIDSPESKKKSTQGNDKELILLKKRIMSSSDHDTRRGVNREKSHKRQVSKATKYPINKSIPDDYKNDDYSVHDHIMREPYHDMDYESVDIGHVKHNDPIREYNPHHHHYQQQEEQDNRVMRQEQEVYPPSPGRSFMSRFRRPPSRTSQDTHAVKSGDVRRNTLELKMKKHRLNKFK
jgi:hypothetical protein